MGYYKQLKYRSELMINHLVQVRLVIDGLVAQGVGKNRLLFSFDYIELDLGCKDI